MPYLTLTYADGTREIQETEFEPRVEVAGGSAVAFHTVTGLVGASYQAGGAVEPSEPDWDDPAFRATVRDWLASTHTEATPTLTFTYADGSEEEIPSIAPVLDVRPGQVVAFDPG